MLIKFEFDVRSIISITFLSIRSRFKINKQYSYVNARLGLLSIVTILEPVIGISLRRVSVT